MNNPVTSHMCLLASQVKRSKEQFHGSPVSMFSSSVHINSFMTVLRPMFSLSVHMNSFMAVLCPIVSHFRIIMLNILIIKTLQLLFLWGNDRFLHWNWIISLRNLKFMNIQCEHLPERYHDCLTDILLETEVAGNRMR